MFRCFNSEFLTLLFHCYPELSQINPSYFLFSTMARILSRTTGLNLSTRRRSWSKILQIKPYAKFYPTRCVCESSCSHTCGLWLIFFPNLIGVGNFSVTITTNFINVVLSIFELFWSQTYRHNFVNTFFQTLGGLKLEIHQNLQIELFGDFNAFSLQFIYFVGTRN